MYAKCLIPIAAAGLLTAGMGQPRAPTQASRAEGTSCSGEDTGIALPPGFCATVFADNLGPVRHMAVTADGTVYINTRFVPSSTNDRPPDGGLIIGLRDADRDGHAEIVARFGPSAAGGNVGGTGIALYRDGLFADIGDRIVRFALKPGQVVPVGSPVTILSGLPSVGGHTMHPFAIGPKGDLFVNSGSLTNACEAKLRQPATSGVDPCTELETRGGIWRYASDRPGQLFSPAGRYATGIRNTGGISFDSAGRMFAVQHGRDQLSQFWPDRYRTEQGVELPAEELISPAKGGDFGWPYCYFDGSVGQLMLAPEYGGDGKTSGRCTGKTPPVAAFPAHWAPNDVLIYKGGAFPSAYRGGAFIAFHGSWNRAPAPQGGYNIVFQPLRDGRPSGPYRIFADGFAGAYKEPGRARFRPSGLAVGPDGALYVSENQTGRVWRITYHGASTAAIASARVPSAGRSGAGSVADRVAGSARSSPAALPPGVSAELIALGGRIFNGAEKGGTCSGCHGSDGRGTPVGPGLVGPKWLWGDGSIPSIARVVTQGVAEPKAFASGMPPLGGAPLTPADVNAVSVYVWSLGHPAG